MHHSKSYLQEPYGASRAFSTHAIYSEGNIFPSFRFQTSRFLSAIAEPYLGTLSRPQCFTLRGLRLSNQIHFLDSTHRQAMLKTDSILSNSFRKQGAIHPSPKGLGFLASLDKKTFATPCVFLCCYIQSVLVGLFCRQRTRNLACCL